MFANFICYTGGVHPTANMICEYCGAPIPPATIRPMAYRLRYHPTCKREVDRRRHEAHATGAKTLRCAQCDEPFTAKRRDAKYCSPRCRVAAHRTHQ